MTDLESQPSEAQSSARDQIELDLEAVLSNSHGRQVVMWFLEQCGIYSDAYTGDNNATNFNLGQRNIGLRLISKLEQLGPTTYPQLLLDVARDRKRETLHVADTE